MFRKSMMMAAIAAMIASAAVAKLPPPSEEQKAKAEEAKVKAAEAGKVQADLLSKAQDVAVQKHMARMKSDGKPMTGAAPAAMPAAATK